MKNLNTKNVLHIIKIYLLGFLSQKIIIKKFLRALYFF
jgi:hypothetical protein